ncbi:MAG: Wzz/FepE/Etk N-terminal domain-containing protein [Alloprevotella sp.]
MNEFDLSTLLKTLWAGRKRVIINCGIAVVVALVIGYSIPKIYTSTASLTPELTDESSMGGGMSSLASLAGIDLGGGTDAIGPKLYPDVIATNSFLVDLLDVDVTTVNGDTCDFKTYWAKHTRMPWWSYGTVGLKKLIKMVRPKKKKRGGASDGKINPKYLSEEEELLVSGLRGVITCSVDDESGVINLSVTTQDPLVSTIIVDSVMEHLQSFITQYRTSKACNDLAYYLELEKSAKAEYDAAKQEYAAYCDTHQGLTMQSYLSEQESLENELQIAYNVYSQTKQQVQIAKAKVQEKTPAFTVLEASSVPNVPVAPRKMLILFACVFLAFFGTVGWMYFRLLFFTKPAANSSGEAAAKDGDVRA